MALMTDYCSFCGKELQGKAPRKLNRCSCEKNRKPIQVFECMPKDCDHVWDGEVYEEDNISSATCSKCGMLAITYSLMYGP